MLQNSLFYYYLAYWILSIATVVRQNDNYTEKELKKFQLHVRITCTAVKFSKRQKRDDKSILALVFWCVTISFYVTGEELDQYNTQKPCLSRKGTSLT